MYEMTTYVIIFLFIPQTRVSTISSTVRPRTDVSTVGSSVTVSNNVTRAKTSYHVQVSFLYIFKNISSQ